MHQLLLGEDGFYDDVFRALRIPYEPVRWVPRLSRRPTRATSTRPTRVIELIHAYRVRGHLMADTDPLEFKVAQPPRPRRRQPRPDAVGPRPRVPGRRLRRQADDEAARRARRPARLLLPHRRHRVHAHPGPGGAALDPGAGREEGASAPDRDEQLHVLERLNAGEAFETFLQTKYVGQKRFSLEGGESRHPAARRRARARPPRRASTRSPSACRTAAGSTCSPTSSARATRRSSASSRATSTRAPRTARAT